jgi:class 3 adenylate cyclase
MGFMVDVAGYATRPTHMQERVQRRLMALVCAVLDELGVRLRDTDRQGMGDGLVLFLPGELDALRALPVLIRSMAAHLAVDNNEFQDRLRLRMAVDIGFVGLAHLGFAGVTVTYLGRLLDSEPLREWSTDHSDNDLAVVVSDRLHSFVVAEKVLGLPPAQFERVDVKVKEFAGAAWLWAGTSL